MTAVGLLGVFARGRGAGEHSSPLRVYGMVMAGWRRPPYPVGARLRVKPAMTNPYHPQCCC